jgi:hypothetical protein
LRFEQERRMFPKSLRRDILLLLCIKAAALTLIYYALVAPETRPEPDGRAMVAHFLHGSGS